METRLLGKTGLRVSTLGFGCSPLGGVFGSADPAESMRAVRAAIDRGINFFDVAPYYGATRAETVLGEALQGVPRDKFIVATKVGRYGDRDFDFSARRVTTSVDESLARLRTETIDLIQCHDIEFGNLDQIAEETLPALEKLRQQGKVRFVGITGLPLRVFPYIIERHAVDTVLSYCHYSLAGTELTNLLPKLTEAEVGIINAAPLCMGLLTNAGPADWHPADAAFKARCADAARFCSSRGVDIASLSLQFAVNEPHIHTTVIGMATVAEVERNLDALAKPLDHAFADEVRRRIAYA